MNLPSWHSQKKLDARRDTIIDAYTNTFGRSKLPMGTQYWTMCGKNTSADGKLDRECEFGQIVESGLITPGQFYGVEVDSEICQANQMASEDVQWKESPHWIRGDFLETIIRYDNRKEFNPGIVNVDHIKMPHSGGVDYLAKILKLVDCATDGDVMIICNLILKIRSHSTDRENFVDCLNSNPLYHSLKGNWYRWSSVYAYDGSNVGKTTRMGTVVMFKKNVDRS
jgi:hypothetical protein